MPIALKPRLLRQPMKRPDGEEDIPAASAPPQLAYFASLYPLVSHTFIRREIVEVERRGFVIHRISIRSTAAQIADPADRDEAGKTFVCLDRSKLGLAARVCWAALRHPVRMARAFRDAVAYSNKSRGNFGKHIAYLVEAVRLVALVKEKGIEHVHVHFGTNAATVAVLMKRLADIRFSMTVHGSAELDAPLANNLSAKVGAAEFTCAISHYTKAQLMRFCHPRDWDRIHIVPCAVDDSFLTAPLPVPEGCRNIVCVGRLSPEKGQLLLLEAFAEAIADGTPGNLVLVGDGPLRAALEAKVDSLGLRGRVELTGWQNEAQIKQHVRASRGLVLPSFYEGLPVVLMEAMAMGRPVLATHVGGIPELVKPGENGWLIPAGDSHEWARGIRNLLKLDTAECDRVGGNGHTTIRNTHAAGVAGEILERLFRSLETKKV